MYEQAIEWVKWCRILAEKKEVGFQTAQDAILLSGLYIKIGDGKKALTFAEEARNRAEKVGNLRDLAVAHRMLGMLYRKREHLEKSLKIFESLGRTEDIQMTNNIIIQLDGLLAKEKEKWHTLRRGAPRHSATSFVSFILTAEALIAKPTRIVITLFPMVYTISAFSRCEKKCLFV